MNAPTRPLLRYLGGKWRLAPWIVAHLPPHEIYVEPFGGAAGVLLRKPRSRSEIYNDVDGELVNLFCVLRDDARAAELIRQLRLTPYARAEYLLAHEAIEDPIERARRLLIRSHMGHGSRGTHLDRMAGFRSDGLTGSTRVAGEWGDFPEALAAIVERLRGVSIDNRSAQHLIEYWNGPNVLLYLDPPYVPETRSSKSRQAEGYHTYAHELSVEEHIALLEQLRSSRSMILLSGYPSELYEERLADWERREVRARAHRNSERLEVLWLNPLAAERLGQGPLFEVAA